ncbi:MAG: cysteine--tRNA ligase [Chloroflexi bacterium RBG_16_64_43]|nr:MAG: cysteine--tRNA ligase [Chloroflexi bacterium RBG_16_64_43]
MALIVYNSLTRKMEPFVPLVEGQVHMYVCGPTVQDYAHIGHAKTYISFDTMVRYFRHLGLQVRYVQNITDVGHLLDSGEDRILRGAARAKLEPMELVERYMRSYFEDMDALGVGRPDISPRASGHIPEQIELTKRLLAAGHAYEVNGSVYFDVRSWPQYGKLSGRRIEEQEEGTRVAVREEKHYPEDFALWKKAEPDHILRWPSPWGWGYPGWHVECSAMAAKYLGETFDIHGGGIENIFPHNECEIAQAEAAFGATFARYWLLTGSLTLDGVKMSKSLGNFVTIKDVLKQHRPQAVRFFTFSSHYRSPVDYSEEALVAAQRGWERLVGPYLTVRERLIQAGLPAERSRTIEGFVDETRGNFRTAMDDDFNAPAALAVLFDFAKEVNTLLSREAPVGRPDLESIESFYQELVGDVLGLLPHAAAGSADREAGLIRLLIELRAEARQRKDWALSDSIRDRLAAQGVSLEDGKDGTIWKTA